MRNTIVVLSLITVSIFGGATSASAHQHVNPFGTCPPDSASVPQGDLENPGDNIPGNRNNAGDVMTNCPGELR